MPELPEVETTVKGIARVATGLTISEVWTDYNSLHYIGSETIKDPKYFAKFKKLITRRTIVGTSRRAKNVLIHLDNDQTILIHLKMTGHIMYGSYELNKKRALIERGGKDPWFAKDEGPLTDPFNKFIHLVFTFTNGKQLVLSDMRKFAKVTLINTNQLTLSEHLREAGPEPLSPLFTYEVFVERLNKKPEGKIKTTLMDQTLIAGVGNIYSDEILWRAGVHPEEKIKSIQKHNHIVLRHMYKALKETLQKGIDFGGDSMSDYRNIDGERGEFQEQHQAYRRTKKPCMKRGCKGTIVRKVVGGRSAHFCDTHQKAYKDTR